MGCHFLLQGIVLTQGSNLCLLQFLHWQSDSLPLLHPHKKERSENVPGGTVGKTLPAYVGTWIQTPVWEDATCCGATKPECNNYALEACTLDPVLRNKRKVKVLVTHSCPTLWTRWTVAPRLLCPWNSPGKNTGVGCHSLLQGSFPIQGLNPSLLHYRRFFTV